MDRILGQASAIETLQTQLGSGRLHHAWIFHGPRGVGKFTTALAFARILLCHQAQPDLTGRVSACSDCPSCNALRPAAAPAEPSDAAAPTERSHPDLHVLTKELAATSTVKALNKRKQMNIPVDLLREQIVGGTTSDGDYHDAAAFKTPQLGHGKVFIIDEAELLDAPGQNALLKTLEEPPAGTTLILVTSSEDRLLPTIRSRCQRVTFVPLPDDAVAHWLAEHYAQLDPRTRDWIAQFAAGSLGLAELAAENDLAAWGRSIEPALEQMATGRPSPDLGSQVHKLIDGFAKGWVEARPNASKDAANRMAAQLMWLLLTGYARRRIALLSEQCDPASPDAGEATLAPWLGVIDAVTEAERFLATNVNLTLICEHLMAQIDASLGVRV